MISVVFVVVISNIKQDVLGELLIEVEDGLVVCWEGKGRHRHTTPRDTAPGAEENFLPTHWVSGFQMDLGHTFNFIISLSSSSIHLSPSLQRNLRMGFVLHCLISPPFSLLCFSLPWLALADHLLLGFEEEMKSNTFTQHHSAWTPGSVCSSGAEANLVS